MFIYRDSEHVFCWNMKTSGLSLSAMQIHKYFPKYYEIVVKGSDIKPLFHPPTFMIMIL